MYVIFFTKMSKAFITDPKIGFNDKRKLGPRIPDHENTFEHKSMYLHGKVLKNV